MNRLEHLLVILAEECSEVAQRASKAIRFGIDEVQPGQDETNARRLERELGDLMAVAEMLGLPVRESDKLAKRIKVKEYMDYARKMGTLSQKE